MASQSSFLHTKISRRDTESNIAIGLVKSLADEGNKLGFSRNHDSRKLKSMNSSRILAADANQGHKRRCFEKLVVRREQNVEDVNCALEVEVIDDTALIEVTASVTGFRNRCKKETDGGYGNKQENDGMKKRNKGLKKQSTRCSMKCANEKKSNSQTVPVQDHKPANGKKISEVKSQKVFKKTSGKVKAVYQRKDIKNPKLVEEQQEIKNQNVPEKIVDDSIQESDLNPKVSNGNEKELITVNVIENTTVGTKKLAYTKEEMEAMRFVDDEGQKSKWAEVYLGFNPTVVKEYTGLLAVANNRQPQRYNRVFNCGYTRPANAILSMPPVLPLCSSSDRKFSAYDRVGFRSNFH